MKRRSANVEEHPKGSGLFRVRARIGGKLETIASQLDAPTAIATADAYAEIRDESELVHGLTLGQFGDGFLDRREKRGVRSMRDDRARWKTYVAGDEVGRIALAALKRGDLVRWRDRLIGKGLARQTIKNALNLVRAALADALDRELVKENVVRDLGVPRSMGGKQSREDLTGVLTPEEQVAVLNAVPPQHRYVVLFALWTGLRWSEQSWLRWEDVGDGTITVRLSRDGKATKSGAARTIPLIGPAKDALEIARSLRKKNSPWVFPGVDGKPRRYRPSWWSDWVRGAGIERRIRWHDLRHTCATALLAGWWSEHRWTLPEIARFLGHSQVTMTERYAQKLDETVFAAARRMKFPSGNGMFAKVAERLDGPLLPKPKVGDSSSPGSAAGNTPDRETAGGIRGTSRELRLELLAALDPEAARPGLAVCRALDRVLAGDEAGTLAILEAEAKAAGGGA